VANPFSDRVVSLSGPATDLVPVTPDDNTDLADTAIALYVEGAGTVAFVSAAGAARSVSVSGNFILPVGALRILATGTTATGIHAMVLA
jgi:hypothetical protein